MRVSAFSLAASVTAGCSLFGGGKGPETPADGETPGNAATSGPPITQAPQQPSEQRSSEAVAAQRASRPEMKPAAQQAYRAGEQAFRTGDLRGAQTQFQRAVQIDARAYQAHHSLGVVSERLGALPAAQQAYQTALSVVPDYEPSILAYSSSLMRSGRLDDAERYLAQQRARLPESAAVLAGLAEIKSLRKDSASAQAFAQEALKKDPGYRPAMVILARDHYRNRRLDLALYALTAILDGYGPENPPRDKDNGEARMLRALIYKEQGHRGPAIEEFTRAIELRPDLVEARINLAAFYLDAGNARAAATLLEEALRYDAANVLIHLNLGDAYRLQGRPTEAIKQLEWVARKDPNLAEAQYNLGLVYMFTPSIPGLTPEQAIDKAIASFERYQEMRPRSRGGAGDDVEDLLKRAKNKKAVAAAMTTGGGGDEFE